MRAFIVASEMSADHQRLQLPNGTEQIMLGRTRHTLEVTEVTPEDSLARLDPRCEIILAAVPVRKTDDITDATLAQWLQDADDASRAVDSPFGPDLGGAVETLVPEVIALRREVAQLASEVGALREREARPLVEQLKSLAWKMQCEVWFTNGETVLRPLPPETYLDNDY